MRSTGVAGYLILGLFACLAMPGCAGDERHVREVDAWHAGRVERLQAEDGWFSLAGLFWLHAGENSFGSADSNDLVFPDSNLPPYLGSIIVAADSVAGRFASGSGVAVDGLPAPDRPVRITSDVDGKKPTMMTRGDYSWYVIDRDGVLGIRLKDRSRPRRTGFQGIERYPVRSGWRFQGRFLPHDPPRTVIVPTVLNTPSRMTAAGMVEFEVDGKPYTLEAMGDPGDHQFWIIFADSTNRDETYPAGRYVYVRAPDEEGNVVIDFNKSYNPPCAFSEFATCPYPPPQNRLALRIEAGEKRYEGG